MAGWNASAERMKGYAADEIVGRSFEVFYPPEELERGEPAQHLAEATATGHVDYQGWRLRKDGSRFWADVVLTAVVDDSGTLRGFGKVVRDATERRNAEQALRDSEEHFRLLVDTVRDYAIVLLDPAGVVIGWNAGAERMKGYPADEIVGRSFEVFYPPDEVERGDPARHLAQATATATATTGHVDHQGWRLRKDGSRFWADVVLTAVLDDSGALAGFNEVVRDVTERRDAAQALRESQERFRLLVDSAHNFAIVMLDPAGRVVGWDTSAERMKEYTADEILGSSFEVFYPPEELERGEPAQHLAEATATGHVDYQGWRLRKDGSRFWADVVLTAVVDDSGTLRGFGKVVRDATERRNAEQALRDSEEHFRLLVDTVRDYAIVLLDPAGVVIGWNAGAERMKGYPADEIVGRSFEVFYPPDEVERGDPARHLAQATATGHVAHQGWRLRKDGSRFWADVVLTAVLDDSGAVRSIRTVTQDKSERHELEAQLAHQALHDPLTGLANRHLLLERLTHALQRLPRHPGTVALLFLDLDRFKLVNDTMGHQAGDELLIQAGLLLRAAVREVDLIARLGGDEFVVLCGDLDGPAAVDVVANRVTRALRAAVCLGGRKVFLSASVGVVSATARGNAVDMLNDADAAMYQAKAQGGGCYAHIAQDTPEGPRNRLQLIGELRRAVERGELRAVYQPLFDLRTHEVVAAEALLRWQHPIDGLLAPATFHAVAEEVGVLADFDTWIMRRACQDTAVWQRELGRPVAAWVNLSGRSMQDTLLPERVAVALEESKLDPGSLTLEITEGVLMRDAAATVVMLTALSEFGVQLAVDHFGTGYSSLAHLQGFPVDALKVDASFVAHLDTVGPEAVGNAAIVAAIVGVAKALGLRIIAEGIATPAQLSAVTALGCDVGQGSFLGRPVPWEDMCSALPHGALSTRPFDTR